VQLDAPQELAAISSFLASQPQNVIPLSVNPSRPIDPELILDFDTRRSRAGEEVARMVADVWQSNPVFLYSKVSLFTLLFPRVVMQLYLRSSTHQLHGRSRQFWAE